ncbi:cysteine desulfurase family protein [Enterococcus cecorum]
MYFDHAATSPMHPVAIEKMTAIMNEVFGNPSSIHQYGRKAHEYLEKARQVIAKTLKVKPHEIIFTSGGTEGDNYAIIGAAFANQAKGRHIISTSIEHPAVMETLHYLENQGFEVTYLPVDAKGQISVADFKQALREDTILVSIMFANNETGNLLPIVQIGEILKDHPAIFHTDAVQAYGKVAIFPEELGIDLLSISAHKINGPKGIGFLYKKDSVKLQPITHGGEQEEKRRAGTENLPAICAMAEVAQFHHEHLAEEQAQIQAISQHFLDVLSQQQVRYQVNGDEANKLPQVWNISFNQVNNQMLLMHLDLANMAISTGSACTAGNVNPSHVLEAMYGKKDEKIHTAIRVSFGLGNTLDEVGQLAQQLGQVVRKFQQA